MPRYVMAIDASKCLNCKACLIACQQRNAVPYGLSRNWVRETPGFALRLALPARSLYALRRAVLR